MLTPEPFPGRGDAELGPLDPHGVHRVVDESAQGLERVGLLPPGKQIGNGDAVGAVGMAGRDGEEGDQPIGIVEGTAMLLKAVKPFATASSAYRSSNVGGYAGTPAFAHFSSVSSCLSVGAGRFAGGIDPSLMSSMICARAVPASGTGRLPPS